MIVVEVENPPSVEAIIERFGQWNLPFVLDSAQANDGLGEWSFFGANPFETLSGSIEDLRSAMKQWRVAAHSEIPFTGGAVGYLSYDYGRHLEAVPSLARDDRRSSESWHHRVAGRPRVSAGTG